MSEADAPSKSRQIELAEVEAREHTAATGHALDWGFGGGWACRTCTSRSTYGAPRTNPGG